MLAHSALTNVNKHNLFYHFNFNTALVNAEISINYV